MAGTTRTAGASSTDADADGGWIEHRGDTYRYHVHLTSGGEVFTATVPDVAATGATESDALDRLEVALAARFRATKAAGEPMPRADRDRGGPQGRHRPTRLDPFRCQWSENPASRDREGWARVVLRHETGGVSVWKYRGCEGFAARHRQRLIAAVNVATHEVKYYTTNDRRRSLRTVVRVAFRRAAIEHPFRLVEHEAGFTHSEGRNYRALRRYFRGGGR